MADRKPLTLDDLDREELLALARECCLVHQRDLVWARYQVASRRARAARDESDAAWDRWLRAADGRSKAFAAGDDRAIIKAMEAELAAEAARDRAEAKVRRLEVLKEQLYKIHQELPS